MTQATLFDRINPEPCTVYEAHEAEVAQESKRLEAATDRILAALRTGPKTNLDLIHVCQRISGRIFDLRKRGYRIETTALAPGVFAYRLGEEPEDRRG